MLAGRLLLETAVSKPVPAMGVAMVHVLRHNLRLLHYRQTMGLHAHPRLMCVVKQAVELFNVMVYVVFLPLLH